MQLRTIRRLFVVLTIALLSGCTTLKDASQARGSGATKVYSYEHEQVWEAAVAVIEASSLDLIVANKTTGEILAQQGPSAFSWGENVAVFVDKASQSTTNVEVVSKRAIATNVLAQNWTNEIFRELNAFLAAQNEGTVTPLKNTQD